VKNTTIWVLVADSASARVLEAASPTALLHEVLQAGHPDSRDRGRDILSDRPGRGHGPVGSGRHGMEPPTDPLEVEAERFAAELAALLRSHRLDGTYQRLYLVAPPHFLGLLRKALDDDTRNLVIADIDKDLARLKAQEIRTHLPERL
jgi:protein required for attachment to host cells